MSSIHQIHELEKIPFELDHPSQIENASEQLTQMKQHLIVAEIAEYEAKVNYLQQQVTRLEHKLAEPSRIISSKIIPLVSRKLQKSLLQSLHSQTSGITPLVEQIIEQKFDQKQDMVDALTPVILQILENHNSASHASQPTQAQEQQKLMSQQNERLDRLESVVQQLGETVLYATQAVDCLAQRVTSLSDQLNS